MKPCTITPVRPVRDFEGMRSSIFAWAQLAVAAIVIIVMSFMAVGCDAVATQTAGGDSTRIRIDTTIHTPRPCTHVLQVCIAGMPPAPTCEACGQHPFQWDIEVAFSTDTTIQTETDTTQCKILGEFADTTHFEVITYGVNSGDYERWMLVDNDSVPFKWEGRVNADSLRATRWNEGEN